MRKWGGYLAVVGAALLLDAASAASATLPVTATLTLQIMNFPAGIFTGAGVGTSDGAGGTASLPAGTLSILQTSPISPPLLSALDAFAVARPSQLGRTPPFAPGANLAFTFGGTTGTMGLGADFYVMNRLGKAVGTIPLSVVGVGGTATNPRFLDIVKATVVGHPYQLGMVTVHGNLFSGTPHTLVGTGFDLRTTGGKGTLQLVSPAAVSFGGAGSAAILSTLTLVYTPEPATAVLLGAALALLAAARRR